MSSLLRRAAELQPSGGSPLVEELGDAHRNELTAFVDRDPYVNGVIASRLFLLSSLHPARFGGTLLGVRDDAGALIGAAFSGGNLLPMGGGPAAWRALGHHLAQTPRVCTSIVGSAAAVSVLWPILQTAWGAARTIRAAQPLLVLDDAIAPHPTDRRLRVMHPDDLEAYLPAATAMFTEELGVTPEQNGGLVEYRRRVTNLIADGRAFGVIDGSGRVVFKADVGAISAQTCQVQGVWVHPDLRGRGLGTAALAGVLERALTLAPTVSLYVNDFNTPACRMYRRLGMHQVATLSTVMF